MRPSRFLCLANEFPSPNPHFLSFALRLCEAWDRRLQQNGKFATYRKHKNNLHILFLRFCFRLSQWVCVCVWAGAEDRVFAYYTLFLFWAEQCKRARTMTAQQRRGKNSKHKWNVYQDVHESRNGRKSKHAPVKSTFLYVLVYGGSPCNSISHHQIVRPNRKWKEERKSNFVEIKDTRTDSPVMHAKSKFHKKRGEKINHIFHSSFGIMDLALDSTSFTEKVK